MGASGGVTESGAVIEQWYGAARTAAIAADVPVAELDWLLLACSDLDRLSLRLGTVADRPTVTLTAPIAILDRQWQRRLHERTPVQYLAGRVTWRHLELRVSPAVLIPRPETELAVDLAIAWRTEKLAAGQWPMGSADNALEHWADLGTGSGAIALGLAATLPTARVWAIDRDREALEIARANALETGLGDRIACRCGSWFEPLHPVAGHLSAIVANPPYIPTDHLADLAPEVIHHEPTTALDGGTDGLDCIRQLIDSAPDYLRPGGLWLVEHMAGQGPAIAALLAQDGRYVEISQHHDLAGRDRFVSAETRPILP